MGQKVHPYGFRLGYNKDWHSHWFAKKQFGEFLLEDLKLPDFRAYAVDGKTRKVLAAKGVKYFYVKIPNQPNVKLRYLPNAAGASGRMAWTGSWAGSKRSSAFRAT